MISDSFNFLEISIILKFKSETNDNQSGVVSHDFTEINEVINDDPKAAYQQLKEVCIVVSIYINLKCYIL